MIDLDKVKYQEKTQTCLENQNDYDLIITKVFSHLYANPDIDLSDYQISILST